MIPKEWNFLEQDKTRLAIRISGKFCICVNTALRSNCKALMVASCWEGCIPFKIHARGTTLAHQVYANGE